MTDDDRQMYSTPVLMALAELRFVLSPKDGTKARDLADLERREFSLKMIVDWFKLNPRSGWYQGIREIEKRQGFITPVGTRGETVKAKDKAEIDREAAEAFERERSPEAVKRREENAERLRKLGFEVKG